MQVSGCSFVVVVILKIQNLVTCDHSTKYDVTPHQIRIVQRTINQLQFTNEMEIVVLITIQAIAN